MVDHPVETGDAVVQSGGKGSHLRGRRGSQGISEVDHHHGDAVGGNDLAPGPVHAVVARHRHHPAPVDVVHAGHRVLGFRSDHLQVDEIAVGLGDDLFGVDVQTLGRGELLGVAQLHHLAEFLGGPERFGRIGLGQQGVATVHVPRRHRRSCGQERLDPRVEPGVPGDIVGHGGAPFPVPVGSWDRRAVPEYPERNGPAGASRLRPWSTRHQVGHRTRTIGTGRGPPTTDPPTTDQTTLTPCGAPADLGCRPSGAHRKKARSRWTTSPRKATHLRQRFPKPGRRGINTRAGNATVRPPLTLWIGSASLRDGMTAVGESPSGPRPATATVVQPARTALRTPGRSCPGQSVSDPSDQQRRRLGSRLRATTPRPHRLSRQSPRGPRGAGREVAQGPLTVN